MKREYGRQNEVFSSAQKTVLPAVYITQEVKQRLDLYIQCAAGEISGLGTVERFGAGDFLVTAVHLFEQECTGASTELSQEDVARFLLEAVRNGIDTGTIKLWWHSHCDMECFWSGTDDDTASRFGNGWMLAVVGNKVGQYRARLDFFEPVRMTLDNLEVRVRQQVDPDLKVEVEAEIAEKCRQYAPNPIYYKYLSRGIKRLGTMPRTETVVATRGEVIHDS